MNETDYQLKLEELFVRFPSVQKSGFGDAYKPGLAHMEAFNALLGHPDKDFRTIHVAGTNGKGSVANMLASALAATGLKVGLYTSPHILDFRERMRILDAGSDGPARLVRKQEVWDFISRWEETFDRLDLSFFEITTGMAFRWFADEKVDLAVIEVGLGGRLDSTNVITPEVSVITSIGLDHCAMLGDTRAAIAGEKAGIFKPGVPAVVGSRDAETAPVFEARAALVGCPLYFADADQRCCSAESSASAKSSAASLPAPVVPGGQGDCSAKSSASAKSSTIPLSAVVSEMDLQGEWQAENLRTVLKVLEVMEIEPTEVVLQAIEHTARRMEFHGRWEMLRRDPDILCDIGHNPPALARNFTQLQQYLDEGRYDRLIIVYGVMADKDLDGIIPLMPADAIYIAVAPDTPRAMKADVLFDKLSSSLLSPVIFGGSVSNGLSIALDLGLAVGPPAAIRQGALSRCSDPTRVNAAQGPLPILQSAASYNQDQSQDAAKGPLPIRQSAAASCPDQSQDAAQGPLPILQSAAANCEDHSQDDTQGPLPILQSAVASCPDHSQDDTQGSLMTLQSGTSEMPGARLPGQNAKKSLIYIGGSTFVVSEAIATSYYE